MKSLWLLPILFSALPLAAQTTFATITGEVRDDSGATVPNVAIVAVHAGTNYEHKTESNAAGQFSLAQLRDGKYRLTARAPGFQEFVANDITVLPREIRRVDISLRIGAVETRVEVSAGAALIETETARISDSKSLETMRALPATRRRAWDYFTVTPNVNGSPSGGVRMAGGRNFQAEMTIDGVTIANANGGAGIGPLTDYLEHVQEMRIDVANTSAEFGTSGQIGIVTKGGTNELHGAWFDYYSTPWFRARNPFSPARTPGVGHKMGWALNGPVYLSRLYNGRNRTFFLFTLERDAASATNQILNPTVPLPAWRAGDFSGLAAVRDPFASNAPFAGNRIPASRMNPVSQKIQDRFYPLPNFGDVNTLVSQNYREAKVRPYDPETYNTVRLDHRFSDKAFVYGRITSDRFANQPYEGNLPAIGQRKQNRKVYSTSISYTHSIRPTLLNEFRWGIVYNNLPVEGPINGKQLVQELGLVGLADNLPDDMSGIFKVGFTGLGLTGISQSDHRVPGGLTYSNQFQDHVNWFRGRHSVKAGVQILRGTTQDGRQPVALFGNVTFSNRYTGHPYADFLLGVPTTAARAFPEAKENQLRWAHAYFVSDEFRVSSRLTLSLGLRYEYLMRWTEANDRISVFDISTGRIVVPDGSLASVSARMPRGYVDVVEASQAGYASRTLLRPDTNNFAPRLGVAWRPFGQNTVLRAGAGIYYDPAPSEANVGGPPFTIAEPTFTNTATPAVVFPRVFPESSTGGPLTISLPAGIRSDLRSPYTLQYSATIEHQRWNTGFRASYIATGTRHGIWAYNINQPVPDARPFISKPRRFPNYPEINYVTNGAGHQYHSLGGEIERRINNGLQFQSSLVWARDISDLEQGQAPENAYDRRRERSAWGDIPKLRTVNNVIYQLPFGRGKRWLSGGRVMSAIAGGWELSTVYIANSGRLLTPLWTGPDPVGIAFTSSATPRQVTIRPDRIRDGNLPADQRTVDRWFDVSAFARPQVGSFGSSGKSVIVGPGTNVMHAGLAKWFNVGERVRIRWEWSASNVLNHPNWGDPGINITQTVQTGVISSTVANAVVDTSQPRDMRMLLRVEW